MEREYIVSIEDEEIPVHVVQVQGKVWVIRFGERLLELEVEVMGEQLSLRDRAGKHVRITFHEGKNGNHMFSHRWMTLPFRVEDPLHFRVRKKKKSASTEGAWEVKAPLPGKIKAVLVEPHQRVSPGEGLFIMEAMKMENRILAEKEGVIGPILVQPGQTVEAGEVLLRIRSSL